MTETSWETGRVKGERLVKMAAEGLFESDKDTAEMGAAMLRGMDVSVDALVDVLHTITVGRFTVGQIRRIAGRRIAGFPEAVAKAGKRTAPYKVGG